MHFLPTKGIPRRRHLLLLGSLVLLVLLYPFEGYSPTAEILMRGLTTLVLLSAVYAVSDTRRKLVIAVILVIPAIISGWSGVITGSGLAISLGYFFNFLFFGYVTVLILYAVVQSEAVTRETISGAISVYLLMGLTWASAYILLDQIHPECFAMDAPLSFSDYIYFSFTTLTTNGYGDIVPLGGFVRVVAALEMVVGVLYIAVLVARLVAVLGRTRVSDTGR